LSSRASPAQSPVADGDDYHGGDHDSRKKGTVPRDDRQRTLAPALRLAAPAHVHSIRSVA